MLAEFSNKLLGARQNSNYGIGIPDSLKANLKTSSLLQLQQQWCWQQYHLETVHI